MKRIASLITAFALSLQATGLTYAAIPPPSLGEVRRGLNSAPIPQTPSQRNAGVPPAPHSAPIPQTPPCSAAVPPAPVPNSAPCSAGLPTPEHDADRMIEMVDGTGTTTWDYWDDGQVKEVDTPQGVMLYDYYATTGRLHELTEVVGGGNVVTEYTYDEAGRTETIDKFGETTTFEYDEASRPEKMIYDTGAYALYTYDGRSRILAVEHKNSSNTLLRKETNVYDPASRITSRYSGPASGGVTTTYGYDDVGQLTSESDNASYSATYTYDANGNRTNRTVNGQSETYTVDDSDKLTSVTWSNGLVNYSKEYAYHYSGRPTSITYKTNGITQATETMTWDKESRMLTNSLGNASYAYNGFDARVSKTVGGTTTK